MDKYSLPKNPKKKLDYIQAYVDAKEKEKKKAHLDPSQISPHLLMKAV